MAVPIAADHGPAGGSHGREFTGTLEVQVKRPVTRGRIIIIAGWLPGIRRKLAVKEHDNRPIVGQGLG